MKLTNSILVGADIPPHGGFFFDPQPKPVVYRDLGPSGVMMNCVARPDRSKHYLSYEDVFRLNELSPLEFVWDSIERVYRVYGWTNELDENSGNLKGLIRDEELLRNHVRIPFGGATRYHNDRVRLDEKALRNRP